jgi:hypothetical protein
VWKGWRNVKDPAEVPGAIGGLAMVVFFAALLVSNDDAPRWLLLTALVFMVLGVAGEATWKYLLRRRGKTAHRDA